MTVLSEKLSEEIRLTILEMVYKAKASHIGGALSMVDILSVLYSKILKIDPKDPNDPNRDRFILSKGHACTGLYATLALTGFFDKALLENYAKDGSILLSHTSHKVPGVEFSTGSLGHALSVACGISYAAKLKKKRFRVYCLLSDGELNEGSNWEAILFAPHHKLNNLTVIIDYNKIQSLGSISEVLELHPLNKKFEAFGWNVVEVDGHSHGELYRSFLDSKKVESMPTVIIAHTIKGKGIDFMENNLLWHYKSPSEQEYLEALRQIKIYE